ncbi:DNA-binding protein [Rhodococcus hoagii]|nr:DNA-binding protein [Prescottella equi]
MVQVNQELGLAVPQEVAAYLRTTPARLAQLRYMGSGPRFVRDGRRVLYRWVDIHAWVDGQVHDRTDRRVDATDS